LGYAGVFLGGDGLLQALEAVEEAVGEVDVGLLLPVVVGGGDELVEVVVHEGGLEAEVLVDVVGGVLAQQDGGEPDLLDGCWDWEDAWHVVRRLVLTEMAVAPERREGVDRARAAGTLQRQETKLMRPVH
jgi:hypothetical protein